MFDILVAAIIGAVVMALAMMLMAVRIARLMDRASAGRKPGGAIAVEHAPTAKPAPHLKLTLNKAQTVAALTSALRTQAPEQHAKPSGQGAAVVVVIVVAIVMVIAGAVASNRIRSEPPTSREITAGQLHGTLLATRKPKRVVLIIPGSGPTDRNGDNPLGIKGGSYRLLAEGLAEKGLASVRVDKRGLFASAGAGDPNAVTLEIYADDVHAWIDNIRAETGVKCVWLLGHSEGAIIASAAAENRKDVCGLVLVSGPGRKLGDVLRDQLKANPANAPLLDQAFAAIAELEAGRHVDASTLHPALRALFNAPAQDLLISEMSVDPVELLRRARKRTLIVQGTTDLQISIEDAQRLNAAPRTTLRLIEGMNHVLKSAPADRAANIATYGDSSLPLAPGVASRIAGFIKDDD